MSSEEKPTRGIAFGAPLEIHFFYVVFILVMAIILLVTREWTAIDKFTDYLTAAGTMTSLVLGVLAIIYSFVSSRQQSEVVSSISSSTKGLDQAVGQLGALAKTAETLQTRAETKTESLVALVSQLTNSIATVQDSTKRISEQSQDLMGQVQTVQSQIENLGKGGVPAGTATKNWTAEQVEGFLRSSSVLGLCAAWMVVEADAAKKKIDMTEFVRVAELDGTDYLHGFMVASTSAGLFYGNSETKKENEKSSLIWTVSSSAPNLRELVEKVWEDRLNKNEKYRERWIKYKEATSLALRD